LSTWGRRMTEIHKGSQGHPQPNGGFEREDLGAKPIIAFIITVVVGGIFVYYAIWGMFHFLDKQITKDDHSRSPLVQVQTDTRSIQAEQIKVFPEPRLEDNERTEINDTRYAEEQRLNSSGWVDQSAGVAHIPIERAMQLIAQRGLPTMPQQGTVPPSIVETGRAAAVHADTSNTAKSNKKGSKH
jgi:hypothetical protein